MSKEKRRVPKLRFPGFTEDWEEYRFNNLLKKNLERNDGKFNSNKTISIARMKYNKLGNGASDESLNNYKVLRFGDVAFEGHENKEFKYGRFVMNDIGDGIMSPRFTALRPIKVLDVEFWKEYINYEPIMQKKLVNSTKKGTMMHELVVDEFLKQEILLPSKEEQQKIGRLLKLQSNIINLHQCKVEHLILKKQALLQKLFPRNGNRYPDFRFPGFTAPWEQREFSDIFSEVKSDLSRMLSNDDIGLPVVRANNINDGQLNLVDDIKYWYKNDPQGANTNNYLIEQGDILINFINSEAKMGTAAYVTRRPERDTIYTTNILRCKVNDEYNPYFIYSLTFLNSYKNYIASITKPAVNQASFTTVDFKKYSIKIPTVKEQNQIADLIETFNKLITLHQRKLEHLQIQKKSLLQKLFI